MKCINCQTDNNLKDRTANRGRCMRCNHQFAFEPTAMTGVKITDPMFAKAIADISVNDTLFFTPKQLFYLLDKRSRPKIYDQFYTIPGYLLLI
jgi:DNA-directed RNA polymerase subunit RPC12/RpoP